MSPMRHLGASAYGDNPRFDRSPEKPALSSPDIRKEFARGGFFITIGEQQAHADSC